MNQAQNSSSRGLGTWAAFVVIGLAGVIWAVVDVITRGWGGVPGSTWVCAALGLILAINALYREFGGQPLVTVNPQENIAEEYEEQKRESAAARHQQGDPDSRSGR